MQMLMCGACKIFNALRLHDALLTVIPLCYKRKYITENTERDVSNETKTLKQ